MCSGCRSPDERPDPSCGHRSDRSDGDGDGAGDCGRREGPSPSGGPARRAVQEIQLAEYLSGNWREEHLFNLKSALEFYDMTPRSRPMRRASWRKSGRCIRWSAAINLCPSTPMRSRRTIDTTCAPNCGGVDLTRIDGIGAEAALTDRGRPPDGLPLGEALRLLAALSENGRFRGQAAPLQEARWNRVHPCRRGPAHGSHFPEALQDRSRRLPARPATASFPWPAGWPADAALRPSTLGKTSTKPGSGNLPSLLALNWFHKLRPSELRLQTSS